MTALRAVLEQLLRGELQRGNELALLLLFSAVLLSLAHLITMIITRWGDRHTAFKSLVASLLVHCACFFSIQVLSPLSSAGSAELDQAAAAAEVVIDVLPSETSTQLSTNTDADSIPLADRPNLLPPKLERLEKPAVQREQSLTPERDSGRQGTLTTTAPAFSQFEPQEMQPPEPPRESNPLPAAPTGADPAADLQTIFAASMADLMSATTPRIAGQVAEPLERRERAEPPGPLETPPLDFSSLARSPSIAVSPAVSPDQAMLALPTDAVANLPEFSRRPSAAELPGMSVPNPAPQMTSEPDAPGLPGIRARLPRAPRTAPERLEIAAPNRFRGTREIGEEVARQQNPGLLPSPRPDTDNSAASEALALAEATMGRELALQPRLRQAPPAVYQLRGAGRRTAAAKEFGGTQQSEQAVERSLRWLASVQSPDGRWDASAHGSGQVEKDETGTNRDFAGREADTGVTGLAVLCFLGAGYTHEQGPYTAVVDHALDWLLKQQAADGNLFGQAEPFAQMYCHAIATCAIAEAFALQRPNPPQPILPADRLSGLLTSIRLQSMAFAPGPARPALSVALADGVDRDVSLRIAWGLRRITDERLRRGLTAAVRFIIARQDQNSGGWRYQPGQEGDVSMLGWQLMALKSAELGGLAVPGRVRSGIQAFLNRAAQGNSGGLFGYRPVQIRAGTAPASEPVTPAMTAEALFCRQMLGLRTTDSSAEAVNYLIANLPAGAETNFYYWYYGSLALHQHGGREWQVWNERTRELLIAAQVNAGPLDGSWAPTDVWGRYGGRLYSTAMATLTLEVYYRLLPIQQRSE